MIKKYNYLILCVILTYSCQNNSIKNKHGLDVRTELALDYIAGSMEATMLSREHSIFSYFLNKKVSLIVVKDDFIKFNSEDFLTKIVENEKELFKSNRIEDAELRLKWYETFKNCNVKSTTLEHPTKEFKSTKDQLIVFRSKPCQNFHYFFLGDSTYSTISWTNGRLDYLGSAVLYLFEFSDKDEIKNIYKANVEFG